MPKKKKNIKNCDALMALDKLKEWLPAITEILIKFVKCNRRQLVLYQQNSFFVAKKFSGAEKEAAWALNEPHYKEKM